MDAASVDRQRFAGLHRLVGHVKGCGMAPVPAPVATLDGETFFESQGHVWQLEPWMTGTADFVTHPSEARLRAALESLAHWHRAAVSFKPRDADRKWFFTSNSGNSPGLRERAAEIGRWDGQLCQLVARRLRKSSWKEFAEFGLAILDRFVRTAPRIALQLNLGLDSTVPLQPCLRDIWHDHVLFTGERVTGLIDPFAARSDSVATDLARLLGTMVGDDRPAWETGLAAYQQLCPLTVAEMALVELFDQSAVLLSGMTWLDSHCLQGRVFDNPEKVLARLQAIVNRLEHLAEQHGRA